MLRVCNGFLCSMSVTYDGAVLLFNANRNIGNLRRTNHTVSFMLLRIDYELRTRRNYQLYQPDK